VTLVSDDPDPPYDRTFCSKQYLSGKAPREKTMLAPDGFYGGEGPRLLRDRVVSLDLGAEEIVTAGGERLAYDALVIATGAAPLKPDLPGFDRPEVHTLRSLKDADALIAAAEKARSVAVVGASFIGLEVAAAMIAREKSVTVVAPDAVPLAKVLGEAVGRFVQGLHEEKGVTFRLGRKVEGFDGTALTLDDGSRIEADLVVLGTGVSPRVDLAAAAGLALARRHRGRRASRHLGARHLRHRRRRVVSGSAQRPALAGRALGPCPAPGPARRPHAAGRDGAVHRDAVLLERALRHQPALRRPCRLGRGAPDRGRGGQGRLRRDLPRGRARCRARHLQARHALARGRGGVGPGGVGGGLIARGRGPGAPPRLRPGPFAGRWRTSPTVEHGPVQRCRAKIPRALPVSKA
jgi:NADPH-dependent 2,4-dienoyl-CoA reductase/sulfur reductase-like enzyme